MYPETKQRPRSVFFYNVLVHILHVISMHGTLHDIQTLFLHDCVPWPSLTMPPTIITPSAATFPIVHTTAIRPEARTLTMLTAATNTANTIGVYNESADVIDVHTTN